MHDRNPVSLLQQPFAHVALPVADDGIAGPTLAGQPSPDVRVVDRPPWLRQGLQRASAAAA